MFLGTGEIALPAFRWLIGQQQDYALVALVTQPDRPAGRRRVMKPSVLKSLALEHGCTVFQPERIRDADAIEVVRKFEPDLIVVMAYGQILPQALIDIPPLGCVNLHASLLPKYRGAACIQAAIDAGDRMSGVSLMHVVRKLDEGDVILSCDEPIHADDTGGSLHDRLAETARDALAKGLPGLCAGEAPRTPQAELGEATYVPKLERGDGRLDWSWSAERLERRLRAYDPWPGCWTTYRHGGDEPERVKIFPARGLAMSERPAGELVADGDGLIVACGESGLRLGEVQPDGGRRMDAHDWWRRFRGDGPKRFD